MLRTLVVKKYIHSNIEGIVGHNPIVYIRGLIFNLFILVIAYGLRTVAENIRDGHEYVSLVFGLLGVFLLGKYIIDFLNYYLDAMVITRNGITVFRREGILEYKIESFERDKIELIGHEQRSLLDKLFFKGDIVISLDYNTSFKFENISNPQRTANIIMMKKHQFAPPLHDYDTEDDHRSEKFDVLVETLGEVIQDYMKKSKGADPYRVMQNSPYMNDYNANNEIDYETDEEEYSEDDTDYDYQEDNNHSKSQHA